MENEIVNSGSQGVSYIIYISSVMFSLLVQGGATVALVKYWLKNQSDQFKKLQTSIDELKANEKEKSDLLAGMNTTIEVIKNDFDNQKIMYQSTQSDVARLQGITSKNSLDIEMIKGEIKAIKAAT